MDVGWVLLWNNWPRASRPAGSCRYLGETGFRLAYTANGVSVFPARHRGWRSLTSTVAVLVGAAAALFPADAQAFGRYYRQAFAGLGARRAWIAPCHLRSTQPGVRLPWCAGQCVPGLQQGLEVGAHHGHPGRDRLQGIAARPGSRA